MAKSDMPVRQSAVAEYNKLLQEISKRRLFLPTACLKFLRRREGRIFRQHIVIERFRLYAQDKDTCASCNLQEPGYLGFLPVHQDAI